MSSCLPRSPPTPLTSADTCADRPCCVPGVRDGSGVHVSLAPSLRTYDAESFGLMGGVNPMQRDPLPPGHANYEIPSMVVPAECTQQWTAEEIFIF